MPEHLFSEAAAIAKRENMSIEDYCMRVLKEQIQSNAYWQKRVDRGKHVSRERFLEILRKAPDVEPDPDDRIERD